MGQIDVLYYLYVVHQKSPDCFLSTREIEAKLGTNRSSVSKALSKLLLQNLVQMNGQEILQNMMKGRVEVRKYRIDPQRLPLIRQLIHNYSPAPILYTTRDEDNVTTYEDCTKC